MKHLVISCQEAEIDCMGNKTRIKMHDLDRDFLEDFNYEDLMEIINIYGVDKIEEILKDVKELQNEQD